MEQKNQEIPLLIGRSKENKDVCVIVEGHPLNDILIARASKINMEIVPVNPHYFKEMMKNEEIEQPDLDLMRKLDLVPTSEDQKQKMGYTQWAVKGNRKNRRSKPSKRKKKAMNGRR